MTGDNAAPLDGWQVTPHPCPLPDCDLCREHQATGYGVYPLPENIVLGSE